MKNQSNHIHSAKDGGKHLSGTISSQTIMGVLGTKSIAPTLPVDVRVLRSSSSKVRMLEKYPKLPIRSINPDGQFHKPFASR